MIFIPRYIRIFVSIVAVSFVLSLVSQSNAEDNSGKVIKLEEAVVIGSRLNKLPSAMPNTVTIIDQETLRKNTEIQQSLTGVLSRTVPGFGPALESAVGRGESFRGRNPLYLIDGIPQHNVLRDGQRDGHTIDMDMVERIEVIHGSNSMQGVGGTGGVINIVTKKANPDGKLHNRVRFAFTTHDSLDSDSFMYKGTYNGSIDLGETDFTLGLTGFQRELFFDADGDPVGMYATQGSIMDSFSRDIFFKVGYEPLDGHRLQFSVNNFHLKRDHDFKPVSGNRSTGTYVSTVKGDPSATVGDPSEQNVTTVSVDYTAEDILGWRAVTKFYYNDFDALYEGGYYGTYWCTTAACTDSVLDQSNILSEKMGFKFAFTNEDFLVKDYDLTLGVDIQLDDSSQDLHKTGRKWVPLIEQTAIGTFLQADYELYKGLKLTSGFRVENYGLNVDTYTTICSAGCNSVDGGSPDFTEVLPNGGVVYEVTDDYSLYANYSKGFSIPDVGRVLRAVSSAGQDVDTLINLEPVVTDNLEIGVKYDDGPLNATFALYKSDSDLGSLLYMNDAGFYDVERQAIEIWGFDIASSYRVNDNWSVGGSYAYIQGEYDSDEDNETDTDLDGLNMAPNTLNLYVDGSPTKDVNVRLSGRHLFTRDFTGPGISTEADFDESITLFDFFASLGNPYGDGTFNLGLQNLLDNSFTKYFSQVETGQRATTFMAGKGRTLTFSYNLSF